MADKPSFGSVDLTIEARAIRIGRLTWLIEGRVLELDEPFRFTIGGCLNQEQAIVAAKAKLMRAGRLEIRK